jgi:hypothetical protein
VFRYVDFENDFLKPHLSVKNWTIFLAQDISQQATTWRQGWGDFRNTLNNENILLGFGLWQSVRLFASVWRLIDTAPLDQDVTLLVTDGRGEPYRIPHSCKRTAAGWVSSRKGTPLAVTPLQWKPYNPPRR